MADKNKEHFSGNQLNVTGNGRHAVPINKHAIPAIYKIMLDN